VTRALVYRGPASLVLEERPAPHPGDGEVVLAVDACSICGTDLRIAAGTHGAYADGAGRVPGHEVVGTIIEAGPDVALPVGERVFVAPNYGCGRCRPCRRDQVNLCQRLRAIGITEDGAFADRLLLSADLVAQGNVMTVGTGSDPGALALAEPLACALRGSAACRIRDGDVVVVYGAGAIGLFHVALARLDGAAAVVVCEPNAERRKLALTWGATSAHDAGLDELREALNDVGAADGADAVIVAAPVPAAQAQALELAASQGRVNFFAGLARDRSRVELDTNLVHYKELSVTGTTGSTNAACRKALELIADGRVDTASLIGARLDLASAESAFDLARSGQALRVVMQP
jgi:L-iditol 2-dehydrogenase